LASCRRTWYLLAFALAGCASTGSTLPDVTTGPIATLKFSKGYDSSYGITGTQSYLVTTSPKCEDLKVAAKLLWTTSDQKVSKVQADKPTIVLAATLYYVSTGGLGLVAPRCDKRATFTPGAGHRYAIVSHAQVATECHLEVIDEATNGPPPDLVVADGAACLRAYQRESELGKKPAD
jgi:hypothetical protein